jgi:hypothetical protein
MAKNSNQGAAETRSILERAAKAVGLTLSAFMRQAWDIVQHTTVTPKNLEDSVQANHL